MIAKDIQQSIISDHKTGRFSDSELANKYGIVSPTVKRILIDQGVYIRRGERKYVKALNDIVELCNATMDLNSICQMRIDVSAIKEQAENALK